jgi:uncharacterized protein YkwD
VKVLVARLLTVVVVLGAGLVAPQPFAPEPSAARPATTATATAGYGKRALAGINDARGAHGLRPLRLSASLARAAAAHARELGDGGYFSHASGGGGSVAARIAAYYDGSTVGEVILWKSPSVTPEQAVAAWLESPAHRHVLLHRSFRHVGIAALQVMDAPGVYRGLDVTIVVADFGAP